MKVEEQNRNQINFGAGASQYEGFFVNFSFTTSNFLGRGESVTASVQAGQRSRNYQLSFTEPFVFGRAMTAGVSLYSRKIDYAMTSSITDYSEVRSGFNLTTGMPLRRFTRLFATYGYEIVDTAMTNELRESFDTGSNAASFLVRDGRFIESSITPSLVHDTVDNPFAPRSGMRLTVSYQYAGGVLGGTSRLHQAGDRGHPLPALSRRTALGVRANGGWIWNYGEDELPYYQRYFLGGETQIRGVDIRSVGPHEREPGRHRRHGVRAVQRRVLLRHPAAGARPGLSRRRPGIRRDKAIDLRQLRTSSGLELRVTLPVINVPFRLIYAWNFYRDSFQPARGFKFAVGTTF